MARPAKPLSDAWQSFRSTCFSRARWNHQTERLEVQFANGDGTVYTFYGFPEMQWLLFKSAPSHGKFYWKYIRGRYQAR